MWDSGFPASRVSWRVVPERYVRAGRGVYHLPREDGHPPLPTVIPKGELQLKARRALPAASYIGVCPRPGHGSLEQTVLWGW